MNRILSIRMSAQEAREVIQGKRDSLCILIKPQPSRDAVWVNSGYMKDGSEFIFPTYKPEDTAYIREPWLHTEEGYIYQADDPAAEITFRPGSQMPKEAARLWIRVTGVKAVTKRSLNEKYVFGMICSHSTLTSCGTSQNSAMSAAFVTPTHFRNLIGHNNMTAKTSASYSHHVNSGL